MIYRLAVWHFYETVTVTRDSHGPDLYAVLDKSFAWQAIGHRQTHNSRGLNKTCDIRTSLVWRWLSPGHWDDRWKSERINILRNGKLHRDLSVPVGHVGRSLLMSHDLSVRVPWNQSGPTRLELHIHGLFVSSFFYLFFSSPFSVLGSV